MFFNERSCTCTCRCFTAKELRLIRVRRSPLVIIARARRKRPGDEARCFTAKELMELWLIMYNVHADLH